MQPLAEKRKHAIMRYRSLTRGLVAVRSAFEWMISQRVPLVSAAPQ
jgi:hypothetical protein